MPVATIEFTEERRGQIISLLEILDQGLPEPSRRDESAAGFVNEVRSRTCPDCLANGGVTRGCETCGGSGEVAPARLGNISAADELESDGRRVDPYATDAWLAAPYGIGSVSKFGHVPARDAELDRLAVQLREPWKSEADAIAEANRNPYPWERERAAIRKRWDIDALLRALDELRASPDSGLAALIVAVYQPRSCQHGIPHGDRCRVCGTVDAQGLIEFSATLEAGVDRALRFLSDRLPEQLRAPGDPKHAALRRRDRKAAA